MMQAVILAGGKGTRLKPFTNAIPKPLVPIGDMPILEVVLRQLRYYGVTNAVLAVNHLARLIEAFFGRGDALGIELTYSLEDEPLGTAGPLGIIPELEENFIVMNGDLLTTVNYSDMMDYHRDNKASATIAVFKKDVKIDLGVLETEGGVFVNYIEKPVYSFEVSMGIYIMNRRVLDHIPANSKMDIPDLVLALKKAGEKVVCYRSNYEWLDIGRIEDYETAVELFEKNRAKYLPT